MIPSGTRRQRGAYFTPRWLADKIAVWAIRNPADSILDPAAGAGDLLIAAAHRVRALGGRSKGRVSGVEIHVRTWRRLRSGLRDLAREKDLLNCDFFDVASRLEPVDVVLANPPYVRHHSISRATQDRMRSSLNGFGETIGGRASAWAYFLAVVPALIRPGGRLAMILPAEVLSADYAWSVLNGLAQIFSKVRVIYCGGDVFEELNQQVVLCLAEDHNPSGTEGALEWGCMPMGGIAARQWHLSEVTGLQAITGRTSIMRLLAPPRAVAVMAALESKAGIEPLGDVAVIKIGYVTGANDFFHLDEHRRVEVDLDKRHLHKVLPRLGRLTALSVTRADWTAIRGAGLRCWLFDPADTRDRPVKSFLARGRKAGVHHRFKCRNRHPWWTVPVGDTPTAFMTYMGSQPCILANEAGVLVSNSLLDISNLRGLTANELAIAARTSVFQLSAVLNSRLLSGGLRKLEPSDAARTLIPVAKASEKAIRRVDRLLRAGQLREARYAADQAVLGEALGWQPRQIRSVQRALEACETPVRAPAGTFRPQS